MSSQFLQHDYKQNAQSNHTYSEFVQYNFFSLTLDLLGVNPGDET